MTNEEPRGGPPPIDYTYDGPGIAKGGSGVLKVDGNVVATGKQANSIAFLQVWDEAFDVGIDRDRQHLAAGRPARRRCSADVSASRCSR